MNRDRLTQLAALLRTLPAENFDLSAWHCGTTACAVGHACLNPAFNEQGLRLGHDGFDWGPSYEGVDGWDAVEAFFGLNELDAQHLFSMFEYPNQGDTTASDVADRIDALLATAEVSA